MGAAALRQKPRSVTARRPRLSVVPPAPPRSVKRRTQAAQEAAARHALQVFVLVVVAISVLGIGRVWLSVQAAQASVQADVLRDDIKSERYEGDMLEVRQSALGSPSRIRGIAGATMNMTPARRVTYVRLNDRASEVVARRESRVGRSGFERALSGMMDLTAGEAQVLLVGNVGLASSK